MSKKPAPKVLVAMSGGVDSSVTAYLLKKKGFDVTGVYLQVWSNQDYLTDCPWREEIESAQRAAEKIGIPFRSLHVEDEYRTKVVEYMIGGYQQGITPNPDIMCNREIKFGVFLDFAGKENVDSIATGHYAKNSKFKIQNSKLRYKLLKGKDKEKDQSYFLYTLTQEKLAKILFPIGDYQKTKVRKIAKKAKLPNWDRKDSQGICFIGQVELRRFLKEYINPRKGEVITVDGEKIGEHEGIFYYTIGQRHGLDLGSKTGQESYYIVEKRLADNIIVVAKGQDNQRLFHQKLVCNQLNWISGEQPQLPLTCQAKIRYRGEDAECRVSEFDLQEKSGPHKDLLVEFTKPQWAVAPGQSIVFYQNDECLGGGVIDR